MGISTTPPDGLTTPLLRETCTQNGTKLSERLWGHWVFSKRADEANRSRLQCAMVLVDVVFVFVAVVLLLMTVVLLLVSRIL